MSIVSTFCSNCGEPAQISAINEDGLCPHCATGRVSSPPPEPRKKIPDVSRSARPGHYVANGLDRDAQISSKIPLDKFLAGNPGLVPSRATADSSST
jgi:hypothetical protein